ncbi:ATP-binding protein [Streptomyces sp. NPDC127084]|uniref:ATP-binding protein n=1 Tax=Streptomyces sp. NPDC127084 TaxID=3347133 RepID=UPI00364B314C
MVGRCRDFSRTALVDWGWLSEGDPAAPHPRRPGDGLPGDGEQGAGAWEAAFALDLDAGPDTGLGVGADLGVGPDHDGFDDAEERLAIAEDVLMVVSELVTNACLHADGPEELVLHCTPDRLRIEVSDANPVTPRPRPHADPARPGGHGLVVLGRLARAWGSVSRGDTGKTVWAEITAPRGTAPGTG